MEKIPNFFDVATPEEVKKMFDSSKEPGWISEERDHFTQYPTDNLKYLAMLCVWYRKDSKTADYYIDLIQDPVERLDAAMSAYELDLSWMPD